MGHLYSKPRKHSKFKPTNYRKNSIKVLHIDAKIENRPTIIDENSASVLKYKTPHFRATATIRFPPIDENEVWKIGWIQACTSMEFHNKYGNEGYSSWEFPELTVEGFPMISDSDGKNFPWYGSNNEVILIEGPKREYQTYTITMNDNFHPHVTWDIPTSNKREFKLTNIKRDQSFYTWLVAMDVISGHMVVLKTIKWRMKLEIMIDPYGPPTRRARLISNPLQQQPHVLSKNVKIPNCALYPANANTAQTLVWRSYKKSPEIVVPPKYIRFSDFFLSQYKIYESDTER